MPHQTVLLGADVAGPPGLENPEWRTVAVNYIGHANLRVWGKPAIEEPNGPRRWTSHYQGWN